VILDLEEDRCDGFEIDMQPGLRDNTFYNLEICA
jgi:hypothetical protein